MIVTKLYKGKVELVFNEARHIFTVDGRKIPSVTTATGVIDKSGPLMHWAVKLVKEYLLQNLNVLIEDTKGGKITAIIEEAAIQHRVRKEKAADLGTQVHRWAEEFIKAKTKEDWPPLPRDPQVHNGVTAFLKWVDEYDVKFLSSERHIYSMKHDYAGIMDAEAIIKGKKSVVDFKTSNALYSEMRLQVAAYQGAIEEEIGKKYPGNKWIVRFGKEDAEFEAKDFEGQDEDYKAFVAALTLKRRLKEIAVPYKRKA